MEIIAIDYETYYDKQISIKPLGVDGYIEHPETKPYLVSLYAEDEEGNTTLDYSGALEKAPWKRLKGSHAIAHNARFDETVHLWNLKKSIPADCLPAQWSCTADLSVYLSAPRSLLGATKQLLAADISKAYRGTALGKGAEDFNEEEWDQIVEAGRQDAYYCYQLWKHFNAHWPAEEQELSKINREMGRQGIHVNAPAIDEAISHLEEVLFDAGKAIPWEWGGTRSKTPVLPKEIALECRTQGIKCPASFAESSVEAQEWEAQHGDAYPWIKSLKVWRQGNGFLTKLKHLKSRVHGESVYPFTLKYIGGHTGRFSGDGGFNMQNIYRDERFGVHLRHMFTPRPGCKFLILDYAQVEARILAWVVGMEHTLELIRQGLSIYEVHAIETMGWEQQDQPLKKLNPELYLLAKARVLALGYGCGSEKFQVMAKTLCGLDLDPIMCKKTVDAFRSSNMNICKHWQTLHREMAAATRKPSRQYKLKLPSGRSLDYFDINLSEGMKAKNERGGTSYHYYGGKLCENEIQAIGRDVLRDAMVACAKYAPEYPIVLNVHDEIVFEVPEDISDAEISRVSSLMTDSSPWAVGLPLEVEGELTDRYKK